MRFAFRRYAKRLATAVLALATSLTVLPTAAIDAAIDCGPTGTPVGALDTMPPPVFCSITETGPGTSIRKKNSWVDDFDHGLFFADFSGTRYRVFEPVGGVHQAIHWRHADHWMVDIAPDSPDSAFPDSVLGGALMRPKKRFEFKNNGTFVVEAELAAEMPGYQTAGIGSAWGEIDITTKARPNRPRPGATYGYDYFSGHFTLGCRFQPDTHVICSLFDDSNLGIDGGRIWEMSFFQHVGTDVFGGGDWVGDGNVWDRCGPTEPDAECRMTFRLELTETSVSVFVDGELYFAQEGIPPLPDELLNGRLFVYASSMVAAHDGDVVRFHWDRLAINPPKVQ